MKESYRSSELKRLNKKLVLKYIFLKQKTTRKELSQITGLSNSSITRIITELISEDYILPLHKINESKYGRKSEILSINKNKMKVLVVDIDINTTMLGYGRFDGSVEILKTIPTFDEFEKFEDYVLNFINLFNYNFEYISFSIPGIVDTQKNKIINTPNLSWTAIDCKNLRLKKVIMDNDSNLSMLAEKTFSKDMQSTKNAIFILVKEGIGSGLLLNNKIYRGKDYGAGEIGHNMILKNKKILPLEKALNFKDNIKQDIELLAQTISYAINFLNLEKVIVGGKILNLSRDNIFSLTDTILKYSFKNNKNLDIRTTNFNYVPASMIGACSNAVLHYIENI